MMAIENNGPEAAYPGPDEPDDKAVDTGEGHDSGLEHTSSEPKQGIGERPEDWNPPPASPQPEQAPQSDRDNDGVKTDSLIDAE